MTHTKYLIPCLLLSLCLFSGCGKGSGSLSTSDPKKVERNFFAMDTYMTLSAYGEGSEAALEKAEARVKEIEDELSVTKPGSDVYHANHDGSIVPIGKDAGRVISYGLALGDEMGGAFDITIYPITRAWGFTTGEYHIPTEEELEDLLADTGYEKMWIAGGKLYKPEDMEIDLGALGKGYAAREAKTVLKEAGVTSAILSLGGNIDTIGTKPDGSPWRLGIKNPFGDGNAAVVSVTDKAVVASGTYERYFQDTEGKKYHHIMNPKTGYPVENGLVSLTVVTDDGLRADGLSTALFVVGKDRAKAYWEKHRDMELLLIDEAGDIYVTEGLANTLEMDTDAPCRVKEVWS